MITATVSDLRLHFDKLSEKLLKGETVQILRHGKPFAKIVPDSFQPKSFVGSTPMSGPLPDDLDDPVDCEWEAMR